MKSAITLVTTSFLALSASLSNAQVQVSASFAELSAEAERLETNYFQQELELRREEISLLRQELELKRYEIQLLRREMEPSQRELSSLRDQLSQETAISVTAPKPRPSVEKEGSVLYRWCQVNNIPWRMIPSGGAVVQDGDKLGTYFKHAVQRNGVLFVWARC